MGKFCTNCGKEIAEDAAFCPSCGHAVEIENADPKCVADDANVNVSVDATDENTQPDPNEPLKLFTFIGLTFLFALPVAGFVISLVMGIVAKNVNKKRFAWSSFIWHCVITVILGIAFIVFGVIAGALIANLKESGQLDGIFDGIKQLFDSFTQTIPMG